MENNRSVSEVLKNIRILKSQTDLLMDINLDKENDKTINLALEDLSVSIFKYLKGDYKENEAV
jgi:hypothetical protein